MRRLLEAVFRRHPGSWEVVGTAGDGEQAVRAASRLGPDLVLLDIAMPVMDGLQALPHVRRAAPEALVVMLTGFPSEAARESALSAGAHGYLEKEDLVRTLVPRLAGVLEEHGRPVAPAGAGGPGGGACPP